MRTLDDLARAFANLSLPKSDWTRAAHLRVGAWHVHELGAAGALGALRAGIRRLGSRADGYSFTFPSGPTASEKSGFVLIRIGSR